MDDPSSPSSTIAAPRKIEGVRSHPGRRTTWLPFYKSKVRYIDIHDRPSIG
jgi:hypothetical protein